jgi:hypothetical protein
MDARRAVHGDAGHVAMVMRCRNLGCGLLLAMTVPAWAQAPAPAALPFEITPFAGYRLGGDFVVADTGQSVHAEDHGSFALALNLMADDWTQYELFYGRQSTQLHDRGSLSTPLRIEYLHVGGIVPFESFGHLYPYFGGGLGFTRLSPDSALGTDNTRFSMSFALGLRVPVNRHLSFRFEGRSYLTAIPTDTAVFCRSDETGGLCKVRFQGSVFFQFDLLAGAAFAF